MGRLFWKIFFAFFLTALAAAAATGTTVWLQHHPRSAAEAELAQGPAATLASELASATLRHGGIDALREWLRDTHRTQGPSLLAVDAQGRDLLGRPVPVNALALARSLAASEDNPRAAREVAAAGGERFLLFTPLEGEPRRLRRPPPPPPWELAIIVGIASFAVSGLLAWYLARPIRALRWAFGAAAEGRLETRARPLMQGRRDEIADLGDDFDRMAEQLQGLVAAQRRLMHDVSHELRSPLARLQAAIGLARQSPEKLEASLERIEREVTRLDELVGEALTLARLESGAPEAAAETVDLADLIADIAEDARFEAQAASRRLELRSVDRLLVRGHSELLHRAFENVVRNAVKYTAAATEVELDLHMAGARAVLMASDRGPGIPPGELERVFEPFYRISGDTGKGFGLGLAIARRAVLAHGGSIQAQNRAGGGLVVKIELPLAS
ncbi:MAG TPA: ATP-binding protein [Burkholderiales bacterium]|jgi:two-component system OmpR family sensor kinase